MSKDLVINLTIYGFMKEEKRVEIKTFERFYLNGTKDTLKSALYHEN